ncbi:pentapeptide repeat-containing protein [Nocardia africana]|uniref:Pentapeptide repeat-containing protein n=1 Tax=Nocardia africana TaxID=134964 RepID=A0ABW6NU37_9NOCA
MAAVAATGGIVAGLYFNLNTARANDKQYDISQQKEVTDRYAKAVEELGTANSEIQVGGIYLLERLATDSPKDRQTIYNVLANFVRSQAPNSDSCKYRPDAHPSIAVQEALTVIGRRTKGGSEKIDLSDSCLAGARLRAANLGNLTIERSNLEGVDLSGAEFSNAQLDRVSFVQAQMGYASFDMVTVRDSDFTKAIMNDTKMRIFSALATSFCGALLADANLSEFSAIGSDFRHTKFDLDGGVSAQGLSQDNLYSIAYDETTVWPKGFTPPSNQTYALDLQKPCQS